MEASLYKNESEVAAALAEAKVLEAAAESKLGEAISDVREVSDRTRDYVMRQSEMELSTPAGDKLYQSTLEPIVHVLKSETPQGSIALPLGMFTSSKCKTTPQPSFHNDTNVGEIARYLARRELIKSGLSKFDDRPENYWAYQVAFPPFSFFCT